MKQFIALAVVFLGLCVTPALAQQEKVALLDPTKEGLVAFWEGTVKANPDVKIFEKTRQEGVYNFETTFFPYKGRLKLLNAAITPSEESYYEGLSSGLIEVELLDADESFLKKYAASYAVWLRQNYFYHDRAGGVWFSASKFGDWSKKYYERENAGKPAPAASCYNSWWTRNMGTVIYLVFFGLVIAFAVLLAKKQNKKIWDNHAKALSEQQRGLAIAERSIAISEESLKNQQEMIRLLNELLKK